MTNTAQATPFNNTIAHVSTGGPFSLQLHAKASIQRTQTSCLTCAARRAVQLSVPAAARNQGPHLTTALNRVDSETGAAS